MITVTVATRLRKPYFMCLSTDRRQAAGDDSPGHGPSQAAKQEHDIAVGSEAGTSRASTSRGVGDRRDSAREVGLTGDAATRLE